MMETMIPPQVGMRLWTKNKKKGKKRGHRSTPNKEGKKGKEKKRKKEKKMEKNEMREKREVTMLLLFSTLVLQSSTMIFMIESL